MHLALVAQSLEGRDDEAAIVGCNACIEDDLAAVRPVEDAPVRWLRLSEAMKVDGAEVVLISVGYVPGCGKRV